MGHPYCGAPKNVHSLRTRGCYGHVHFTIYVSPTFDMGREGKHMKHSDIALRSLRERNVKSLVV